MFVCNFFPWAIFAYRNPLNRKVTGLFQHTKVHTANRATNTLFNNLLTLKEPNDQFQRSGIYKLTRETCNSSYIGQKGRQLKTRFAKHQRYVKSTNHETPYYTVFPSPCIFLSSGPNVILARLQ